MHIIYIHQYFKTPDQSGGIRSYEMARRLVKAGHRVSMICGINKIEYEQGKIGHEQGKKSKIGDILRWETDGIDVYQHVEPYSASMSFVQRWLLFRKFAGKALKTAKTIENVDLVFATSTPLTVGDPGRLAAKFHGCPFVFEVRDLWPELPIAMGIIKNRLLKWYLKQMEFRAYNAASVIIALSPGIKDGIIETGYPEERVAMIPNSCDVDLFFPGKTNEDVDHDPRFGQPGDFRFVFSGAHGLANGLDAVLDAVAVLKKREVRGVRFCFIGTGSQKPRLMKRAKDEGLDDYITWTDPISKKELARVLPQMDVGMLIFLNVPAFYRGMSPNKFFDYLAAGIPTLCNYPGWVADDIKEHNAGIVVSPNDPEAFADVVTAMMNRREEMKIQGKNARHFAETVFSRNLLGDQFVQILENAGKNMISPKVSPPKKFYPFIKSFFDRVIALFMIVGLSPLFLLFAVWIKCSSKGSVFFIQERLGRNGKIFRIYKFRTMVDNAITMGTGLRTDENDPRITKIGHFLRKTSLDELPQLINILKGEMSFIGPRPPVPYHPYKYDDYNETQKKRFLVKPGISGYAQVKVRNNATWDERIVYDVEYVGRIGFLMDVYIFFATIFCTVFGKNVYPGEENRQKISDTHKSQQGVQEKKHDE